MPVPLGVAFRATPRRVRRTPDPPGKGLAGKTVELSDGRTVVADHDYLVRSILDPDAQVVEGYVSGIMSAVIRPGSIDRNDAGAMAAYIESLESPSSHVSATRPTRRS